MQTLSFRGFIPCVKTVLLGVYFQISIINKMLVLSEIWISIFSWNVKGTVWNSILKEKICQLHGHIVLYSSKYLQKEKQS